MGIYITIGILIFLGLAIGIPTCMKMKDEEVEWDFIVPVSCLGGILWPVVLVIGILLGLAHGGRWLFERVFDKLSSSVVQAVEKFPRIKVEVGGNDKDILG